MATGMSTATCNSILNAIFNATAYSLADVFMKLHIGDPGSAGTSNAATETTRKQISCSAAASAAITSDADLTWTTIGGSQDATHFSLWDHVSAGNFVGSGTITANAYVAGDTLIIPAGDFDISLTAAS